MSTQLPKPEDHCRVKILIKPVGQFPISIFNRIIANLECKLNRVDVVSNQNLMRVIFPKFSGDFDLNYTRFAELQAFRKVFGLVCVGQFTGTQLNTSSSSPDLNLTHNSDENLAGSNRIRRSSYAHYFTSPGTDGNSEPMDSFESDGFRSQANQLNLLKEEYNEIKQSYNDQLVDSRCVLFGFDLTQNQTEMLIFPTPDDINSICEQIEAAVRELLHSIYFVLESKRLDTSFERMDSPQYPQLPDETKYLMGLENEKSKTHRKKCIGRLRKRVADYAMLTGFFDSALHSYQSAIDLLKAATDLLWLAAAYEGWCCAAMMLKFGHDPLGRRRRNQSNLEANCGDEIASTAQNDNKQSKTMDEIQIRNSSGHHRYRSDEGAKIANLYSINTLLNPSEETTALNNDSSCDISELEVKFLEEEDLNGNSSTLNRLQKFLPDNGSIKRKAWHQLLNFETSLHKKQSKPVAQNECLSIPSSAISSASRSSSAQNLVTFANSVVGRSKMRSPETITKLQSSISRAELSERFQISLENYGRFSFAVFVEYECVMRAVQVLVQFHQYIEVESFLREHTCRFLDDKFTVFNNAMKSTICLAVAEVYKMVGFIRKFAFFLRLAVFFCLFLENNNQHEYRKVYPVLYESLGGYGIIDILHEKRIRNNKGRKLHKIIGDGSRHLKTYSLQVKAVHEVYTVALRAGLHDAAVRHLCFMMEAFYDILDKPALLSLIEELNKLMQGRDNLHQLNRPISIEEQSNVFIPALQLTRFPTLKNFRLLPLPAHLAPRVLDTSLLKANIFIYSPFQERIKNKEEVHWVEDCACEVSVVAHNPLPIELAVNNLLLLTEGCRYEAIPIRLNLPSCYGSVIDPSRSEVKLLGVPRSSGVLKIIGYSCEILGCKNICKFVIHSDEAKETIEGTAETKCIPPKPYSVRILPSLPILQLETLFDRSPTLSDNPNDSIVELHIFSGQSFTHSITLFNSSESVAIRNVTVRIQQPQVFAGPKLLEIISDGDNQLLGDECKLFRIGPGERREMCIKMFGIDPTTSTSAELNPAKQKEQKVFVRQPTSTSLATIITDSGLAESVSIASAPNDGGRNQTALDDQRHHTFPSRSGGANKRRSNLSAIAPLLEHQQQQRPEEEADSASHDLIPYIGRLLSAEFSFSYTADLEFPKREEYMRFAKLPLAVTIVPAVNVLDWRISSGESPFTRYVVVDVLNQTKCEAELCYNSEQQKKMFVQPKETCRVPLLCPCCTDIQSSAFHKATQRASHMMQMQEIDRLRRTMEKFLSSHLEIKWKISRLNLSGQVPIGSLLSSVSFLRQLVVPPLTIDLDITDKQKTADKDISARVGEPIAVKISLYSSLDDALAGEISLCCSQDLLNGSPNLERQEDIIIYGSQYAPFSIEPNYEFGRGNGDSANGVTVTDNNFPPDAQQASITGYYQTEFHVAFCYEGLYKVRPTIKNLNVNGASNRTLSQEIAEDIFIPQLSFNVT